ESYVAPFDVRFPDRPDQAELDEEVFTVVQPDIVVYCDEDLLDDRGAHGAPAMAVEILSPSTGFKDQSEKLLLYERTGVREYWVVNPHAKFVMVYSQGKVGGFAK